MPPDRGRASRACTACRKQKTRCYESGTSGSACLRCERLRQPCSFAVLSGGDESHVPSRSATVDSSLTEARLARLEKSMSNLLDRLGDNLASDGTRLSTPRSSSTTRPATALPLEPGVGRVDHAEAPVFVIRDLANEIGVESRGHLQDSPSQEIRQDDVVENGLICVQDALSLLSIFQEHYGRWVCFDASTPPKVLLSIVRRSPLLLCACCLIAVRHTTQDDAERLATPLFERAKALLSARLLAVPQTIEFFQAALVLCMWSTTIGQVPMGIDSWLLSGFALQHCLSSDLFAPVRRADYRSRYSKRELDRWCIWNHLCLTHLHYCVGTQRKAILDHWQIDRCREVLNSDHATNFESRMVAEVNLYWVIYEHCSAPRVDLPKTQADLHAWKQQWTFVLEQPRAQFLEMGFHFAQLLVYDQSLKSRSARVRESLLSEMVRLSATIIQLAIDTADDRTRHLTDHIYHMITFAAVTLCRVLHLYEDQLAASHDIAELDSLIMTLTTWLRSIGLPCHAAHTLGDVVEAFHKKLRPHSRPSPAPSDPWSAAEFAPFFPELLGAEQFENGHWDLLPDWEPFYQGPAT
ncbi:hypothetical protein BDY21DRAFT_126055 [Lineolata rhizophorae]|uniref:Transcriptional activator of proteases prtT n=1 Tax=Lineolata rhizophorae TaxID=578093 RepID=A0A6A6NP14_9PEZI|nr:hypothetical protein BDY21DRAFT_126055 [Lineolata rhizophorae]